jgi:hypothetical protein
MILTKLRWWLDSVQGLRAHIALYKAMSKAADTLPPEQRAAVNRQLRAQQGMVGSCLLAVLLVHPIGSGRFLD